MQFFFGLGRTKTALGKCLSACPPSRTNQCELLWENTEVAKEA